MAAIQVLIGGYMHSGTTLLYTMLKRHTALYGFGSETRFFERLSSYEGQLKKCSTREDRDNFASFFAGELKLPEADLNFVNQNISLFAVDGVASLFSDISAVLCSRHNCVGWLEKTPTNVFFIKNIVSLFPQSKIILVHRDFRDVLSSKKKRTLTVKSGRYNEDQIAFKTLEKDWNVIADALSWNRSIDLQSSAVEHFPQNVLVVSYEDLVRFPERELGRIFDFIGIEYDEKCLQITFSNSASIEKPVDNNGSGIYVSSIGVWEKQLSRSEIVLGTYLTRARLCGLGYQGFSLFRGSHISVAYYFVCALPGVLNRIYKRFRMFGLSGTISFTRNYLRRFGLG